MTEIIITENKVICMICNKEYTNNQACGVHLQRTHKIDKLEYIKTYLLNNNIPKCKCGCGEELTIRYYSPYIVSEYKNGHNSRGENNPNYNKTMSEDTKQIIKDKAILRTTNNNMISSFYDALRDYFPNETIEINNNFHFYFPDYKLGIDYYTLQSGSELSGIGKTN